MRRRRRRRREGLRLTDKRHPAQGVWSTVLGVVSVVAFLVLCIMAGEARGRMGIEAGFLGLGCVALSIFGFALAWMGLKLENIRQLFPSIGIVINGLMILCYLLIYILGTA